MTPPDAPPGRRRPIPCGRCGRDGKVIRRLRHRRDPGFALIWHCTRCVRALGVGGTIDIFEQDGPALGPPE